MIQTNQGNNFSGSAINAYFERNNLTLQGKDGPVPYSMTTYVHRLMPEVSGTGSLNITVGIANSTQESTKYATTNTVNIDTDRPWVNPQQNKGRTITLKFGTNDATDTWLVSAMNWQATVTEDVF